MPRIGDFFDKNRRFFRQEMLGMLQDAGNATTLANYLEVLGESKLLTGLQKYSGVISRKYKSIPKLQVYNNALLTVMSDGMTFEKAYTNPQLWGRWVESAVGCHLLDKADELEYQLYYWRENNEEVDFVITRALVVAAILSAFMLRAEASKICL